MYADRNLLKVLINASERAANIARLCRSNQQLLALLVQEKTGNEANARFEHDFKTLADVLIQEAIKHDIEQKFPEMTNNIKGEESPKFINANGDTVNISVGSNPNATLECLLQVLPKEYEEAASALTVEVHSEINFCTELCENLPQLPDNMKYELFGIWIDPIDATAEYISGESIFTNFPGITSTGLDCVTILIGVYELVTGNPVIGIVSQPFGNKIDENHFTSSLYWGVALPCFQAHSKRLDSVPTRQRLLGIFSNSESPEILQQMRELGYEFIFSAGAGHKSLKVITAEVDVYVLSKGSTYKWDTCAPHAILRSLNGDMYTFRSSINAGKPLPLKYISDNKSESNYDWKCNSDGIIAVRDSNIVGNLLKKLSNFNT